MPRHGTPMIKKKIRYGSLAYETLFDTLIGDALNLMSEELLLSLGLCLYDPFFLILSIMKMKINRTSIHIINYVIKIKK
jgi:hypothetical protein